MITEHLYRISGREKGLAWLLDPDKCSLSSLKEKAHLAEKLNINLFFVGGSLLFTSLQRLVTDLKALTKIPVVIFPGSVLQVCDRADGILLLSLISGRNPDYLIGNHVIAAPMIKETRLEVIPTGYLLVDGGVATTVQYISNTNPIPANKPDLAMATAMAGEMLGLKIMYLDAGRGALNPVSEEIIRGVRSVVKTPIIVGGGIRTKEQLEKTYQAGADMVVVGNALEASSALLESFVEVRQRFNTL